MEAAGTSSVLEAGVAVVSSNKARGSALISPSALEHRTVPPPLLLLLLLLLSKLPLQRQTVDDSSRGSSVGSSVVRGSSSSSVVEEQEQQLTRKPRRKPRPLNRWVLALRCLRRTGLCQGGCHEWQRGPCRGHCVALRRQRLRCLQQPLQRAVVVGVMWLCLPPSHPPPHPPRPLQRTPSMLWPLLQILPPPSLAAP